MSYIDCTVAKMIQDVLLNPTLFLHVYDSGKTLRDFLEALPREWISEDLMEALVNRGVHLSSTM